MVELPGAGVSLRPLHFYWLADCSGSMSLDGKVQALNAAIREALPHMRDAADQNPSATVNIRAMRFSSGARWIDPNVLPIASYTWRDQAADDVPRTAAFAAEFRDRLLRENAATGDVQVSLLWNNYNDLDLHVDCPNGHHIYFGAKKCGCGGELDVDMNVSPTSQQPVENVYWPQGRTPKGRYKVSVNHYRNHGRPGCADPTPYKVAVKIGASVQEFTGRISHGQTNVVHEFSVDDEALQAGTGGNTDMAAALRLLAEELRTVMPRRAYPPVVVMMSDGQPTDDFEAGLRDLMSVPWGKRAVRMAIGIGADADKDVLKQFVGNPEIPVLQANNPQELIHYIRWVSTSALTQASMPNANGAGSRIVPIPAPSPAPSRAGDGDIIW